MRSNRRAVVLAGILVVLLAIWAWRQLGRGSTAAAGVPQAAAPAAVAASPATPAAGVPRPGRAGAGRVPEVDLDKLRAARAEPEPTTRNLFRFQPTAPPPPPPGARAAMAAAPAAAPVGPPPPPPPIPLKLIGIIDGARGGKIAVLTDNANKGDTFYGQEGDVIDGRYRILKIGIESVDMEYVDGRGRQPIRLSGE